MQLKDFLSTDYIDFSLYTNYRMLSSIADGFKPSGRKIAYAVDRENINEPMKVLQLSTLAERITKYLHGSLEEVVVGMARSFVTSNNMPLLTGKGAFGTRFVREAAASRYIAAGKNPNFSKVFSDKDKCILQEQEFEGASIEYKYYLPILPMIMVNGASGIGVGWKQDILPRNPEDLRKAILDRMGGKPFGIIPPWWKGFQGTVVKVDDLTWDVFGKFERINSNKILITEVPISYSLLDYQKVLNKLEENKIIKSYEDLSEKDVFRFELSVTREFSSQDDSKIYSQLKLVERLYEKCVGFDENNRVIELKDTSEVLEYYYQLRLKGYADRIPVEITNEEENLIKLKEKKRFLEGVLSDEIKVFRVPKSKLVEQLETLKFERVDESFDYLTSMSIESLTEDQLIKLDSKIKSSWEYLKWLSSVNSESYWKKELAEVDLK